MTKLALVTPVHMRYELAELCLRQRAETLKDFPVETVQIVVGDDPVHRALARKLGLEWVEKNNDGVGAKFNAGFQRAADLGCTHAMAVGSDSFLHSEALAGLEFGEEWASTITGLTCYREDGLERIDVFVRYPAGYGVGMVYPVSALMAVPGGPCEPTKMRGCDGSTWNRVGLDKLTVRYKERCNPLAYINFCSGDVQITGYAAVKNVHASRKRSGRIVDTNVFEDLLPLYGEHGEAVAGFYAARSIGNFLRGKSRVEQKAAALEVVRIRREKARLRRLSRPHQEEGGPFLAVRGLDK